MPAKLHKTVSHDGTLLSEMDQIEQITQEIEQHDHLMEANYKSEQARIDTIKLMPQSLAAKRIIRARLLRSINRRSHLSNHSGLKNVKFFPNLFVKRARSWYRQVFKSFDFWYGSMKEIEGRFGSKIGVYFKILKYLVMLNIFVAILVFSFIILPQILYDNFQASSNNHTATVDSNNMSLPSFEFVDILTAEGYLRNSIMFYGAYTNETISIGANGEYSYSLPYAYFLTMTILYTVIFIVISISLLRCYRASFIEAIDNTPNFYCHKIFCAWDFGLQHLKAAETKHKNIYRELKDLLLSEHKKIEDERLSQLRKVWNIMIQITAHITVLAIIIFIGVVLWGLFSIYERNSSQEDQWKFLYIPVVINSAILICSIVFTWISKAEEYKFPRTTIHIRLLRNFLLEISIVSALLVFWISKNDQLVNCWESIIGGEVYRIMIIDFFMHTIGTCFYYFIRYLIHKSDPDEFDLPEFDITHSSLGLVFNQFIFWVGLPFSPFLSLIAVMKFILMFYIMKVTLIKCCKAPMKLWKSKQIQTFFLVGIFTTLVIVFVVHGLVVTKIPVSKTCGPFRNYTDISEIFMDGILKLKEGQFFWKIFTSFTKPAFVGGILLTMCVSVYYLRAKAHGQIAKVKLLKEMLYLEAKDKEFLLGNISRLAQGKSLSMNLHYEDDHISEPEMPIDGFADDDWKYENNLVRNLRLDFEHIPTTSGYTSNKLMDIT
ncbi:hypothetical protein ACKWTF_005263 [Chironomus riparius]